MVLRIDKVASGNMVVLRLSGRLQSEHLKELQMQIDRSAENVILDLGEVKLVDLEAVRFLAASEAKGVKLTHCSAYIRDWIDREKTDRGNS